MPAAPACPTERDLGDFVAGFSSEEQASVIEGHIASCPACLEKTRQAAVSDTLGVALRAAIHETAGQADSPSVRLLIEKLKQRTNGDTLSTRLDNTSLGTPVPPVELSELLSNVQPPESAEELGRLGDFRLLSLLGVGGMGAVLLAEDTQLHRRVALKLLKPELASRSDAGERFLREARSAAAVKHEHVVTIYQVGRANGVPFIAQELLEGESLEARLKREPILPMGEAIRIGREIALGLAAAHAKGLLHRDIKPANIWLESPGAKVKILDFGLARLQGDDIGLTKSGMIVGTPAYMSPEQASSEPVDARSDLFSLGAVLYRMVTGRLPFQGNDMLSILRSLAVDTPPPARTLNAAVPAEFSRLLEQLLEKTSSQRPGDAQALADQLQSIHLPPPRAAARAIPVLPVAVSVVVGIVLLLLVVGSVASNLWQPSSNLALPNLAASTDGPSPAPPANSTTVMPAESGAATPAEAVKNPATPSPDLPGAEALAVETTEPFSATTLVPAPAKRQGLKTWTLETKGLRSWPQSAAISPDRKLYAAGTQAGLIHIWNTVEERLDKLFISHVEAIEGLAWSSDSRFLASRSQKRICVWDYANGTRVEVNDIDIRSDRMPFANLGWSPAAQVFLIADTNSGIHIWNSNTSERKRVVAQGCRGAVWNRDGKLVAASMTDGSLKIFATESWEVVADLGKQKPFYDMQWCPAEDVLLTTHSEQGKSSVEAWSTAGQSHLYKPMPLAGRPLAGDQLFIAWSQDGDAYALPCVQGNGIVCAERFMRSESWGTQGGPWCGSLGGFFHAAYTTLDSPNWLISREGLVRVPNPVSKARGELIFEHENLAEIQVMKDRAFVATRTANGWGTGDRLLVKLDDLTSAKHASPNWSPLIPSSTGNYVVEAFDDRIDIYDASFQKSASLPTQPAGPITALTWSADERRVAGAFGNKVLVWDVPSARLLNSVPTGLDAVSGVSLSEKGERVAVADLQGTLKVWSADDAKLLLENNEFPKQRLVAASWSADGEHLLLGYSGSSALYAASIEAEVVQRANALGPINDAVWHENAWFTLANQQEVEMWSPEGLSRANRWSIRSAVQPACRRLVVRDGELFAIEGGGNRCVRVWNVKSSRPGDSYIYLTQGSFVKITSESRLHGSPGIEERLIVVAEDDGGAQHSMSLQEFETKYKWKFRTE